MAVILPFSATIVSASRIGFSSAPESISPILRITSLLGPVGCAASWAIVLSLTRYLGWRVIPRTDRFLKNNTNITPGGEDHGKHWSAWFCQRRYAGRTGLLGRRCRSADGAGRGEGTQCAIPPARWPSGRNAGGPRRDPGAEGARSRHRPLHRSAAIGAAAGIVASGPHLQLPPTLCRVLSQHAPDDRRRQPEVVREGIRAANGEGSARVRRPHATEQDRGMDRKARGAGLCRAARRRRRRRLWHHGRLRGARHSLHAAHCPRKEVVR